jgi:ankyrin repeat protein
MNNKTVLIPTRRPTHKIWRKIPKNTKATEALFLSIKDGISLKDFIKRHGKLAIKAKINVDFTIGLTPLMYSCKLGRTDIAFWLLDNKCDVNSVDHSVFGCEKVADWGGRNALHYAIERIYNSFGPKHSTLIEAMNYCPDQQKYLKSLPPINAGLISALLENGVEINAHDGDGNTPLSLAADYGDYQIVKMLLSHGANPNIVRHNHFGAIGGSINSKNIELVKLMVRYGSDINRVTHNGTLLNNCILTDAGAWIDGLRYILEIGLSPRLVDPRSGRTPLFSAIAVEEFDCVELLLKMDSGLSVLSDIDGITPVEWARKIGCKKIERYIKSVAKMV